MAEMARVFSLILGCGFQAPDRMVQICKPYQLTTRVSCQLGRVVKAYAC